MIALGIDIGGTRLKAGLVDAGGRIRAARTLPTPDNLESFQAVLAGLREFAAEAGVAGIGCKGIIDPATTRIESLPGGLHYLEGLVLKDLLRGALERDLPVRADNDARVALAGEHAWGAAAGKSDVVMLTLGTGVGGAAIVNGRLLQGHTGAAGHFGHLTLNPDGAPCICGNHGCLETVFSSRAIEAEAFAAVHRGCASVLTTRYAQDPRSLDCHAVFRASAEGDEVAGLIVRRALKKLGGAIAGLIFAFDPEIVILGGQISEAGDGLWEPLRREVAWRTRSMLRRDVPLVPPHVEDRSGIVGAAALAFERASAA